jgi:hypothetical protein
MPKGVRIIDLRVDDGGSGVPGLTLPDTVVLFGIDLLDVRRSKR